jgi:hypothetical protein
MPARVQDPADPDAAGDVHVASDLRAGADRGPGINHATRTDARADVDVARHEHDVWLDVSAAAPTVRGTTRTRLHGTAFGVVAGVQADLS